MNRTPPTSGPQHWILSYLEQAKNKVCDNKTAQIAYRAFFRPAAIGVAAGAIDLPVTFLIVKSLSLVGLEIIETDDDDEDDFFVDKIAVPIIEEIGFRFLIQGSIKWIAFKILPDKDIKISPNYQIKLATLVSIVVTGLLFGAVHYDNGNGVVPVIACSVSGVFWGFLREEFGMVTPVFAHMTINTLLDFIPDD